MATSQNLADMKLTELKELAKQMGLRGTSTMRKPELVATLEAARSGGEAPAGVTVRAPKAAKPAAEAPAEQPAAPAAPAAAKADAADAAVAGIAAPSGEGRPVRHTRRVVREAAAPEAKADRLLDDLGLAPKAAHGIRNPREVRDENGDEVIVANVRRRRRNAEPEPSAGEGEARDLDDILATLPGKDTRDDMREERPSRRDRRGRAAERGGREEREERRGANDRRGRRLRGRAAERDFNERDDMRDFREERPSRRDDQDDLVPVAGIVDVLDSYAFVRTSGYLPGPNDVYVSMGQVKKYGLRKGDAVHGFIRATREGDRRNQRQKFVPLQSIDTINGMSVEEAAGRPQFSKLTPLYPQERLKQETTANKLTGRIMDIVSPIGKGQRGLIVSPPKAGKTITLQNIANSITKNNPEVHLMVVLVDERPEEVTDMERTVAGEVISSTFDRPASDHTTVAELAIERAKRLVELGQDVVVLLDSMTRLARAYNIAAPASGRILSGGVDAQALYPPKKFFGAARNIENGGSLTIISSALVETGSKMDEVIFEEFKGTGNMELRLSRELADKRLFPAIDINASGTRREELITPPAELPVIYRLRRLLGGMEPEQAYQTLVPRLKKTATNRDFLAALVQQANG
ncbi:transcription termination factor Rho [Bifidobacterium pullorum subsp. saeculare]|uniref:Transcription termination factor Rho n=1 Tax=Bifidobacterium pullorum subsp. saeculare TaxID=78257 RepID=A0A938WWP1_9BIFI|nr:transcription termination factor Rho [Bifidobacterium pullorum]MBM6700270.1 transcription termination factor Rho [Bifidobacterium pullorum subsp. saeculare]